jgi:hypothetical protein
MLARLAVICTLAAAAYAVPAFAEAYRISVYGPEETGELEKFLPLTIGATDCWQASLKDGQATEMRFGLLVQGPGRWDDPGIFRYHYELEATARNSGKTAMTSGVCLSSDNGITCETECEGGSVEAVMLRNGDVSLSSDGIRLRYCGDSGERVSLAGDWRLDAMDPASCPAITVRDPEAGVD